MRYIDEIELELVNNKYRVKLVNFRTTFYIDFKKLYDDGFIDWKRKSSIIKEYSKKILSIS